MGKIMTPREEPVAPLASITRPMIASLAASIWAMVLVCRFELASTQSWRAVLIFPLVCLAITACVHGFVVVMVRRLSDDEEGLATRSLIAGIWIPVVWVPSLVVLGNAGSAWVAIVLPVIAGLATVVLLRSAAVADCPGDVADEVQTLFRLPDSTVLRQTIFPLLVASLSAQLGLIALLRTMVWVGGLLLAVACVLLLWRFMPRRQGRFENNARSVVGCSLAALMLTTIAVIPYLKPGPGHDALERLLRMERLKTAQVSAHIRPQSMGYSGIILTLPRKPREEVLPPPPSASSNPSLGRPLVIKFDGAYWYFKEPDERPGPDARIVRGDPRKETIHSTNSLPLLMEAHQVVLPAIKLNCCSAIELNLINADARPGAISVEVLLRDKEARGGPAILLGTLPIVSSTVTNVDLNRAPIAETLSFPIPRVVRTKQFSEITVRIKPSAERARAGSQISVESFVLVR
jgi:hypothetical protein